jgi:hypothetical protein
MHTYIRHDGELDLARELNDTLDALSAQQIIIHLLSSLIGTTNSGAIHSRQEAHGNTPK